MRSFKGMFQLVYALAHFLLLLTGSGFELNSSIAGAGTEASRCIETERQALLAFKQGIVDDYGKLDGWGSEEQKNDCCKWSGVRCSNITGHVIALYLSDDSPYGNQPLRGNLSSSLFELQHLSYLVLRGTHFSSHIPESIGSLNKLKHLDLSVNQFIGPIPSQLGNLTSLEFLDLSSSHKLDRIQDLEWLPHLSSLKYLNLTFTDLGEVVGWLEVVSKLPYLTDLVLQGCSLQDAVVPSTLMINTSSLLVLNLGGNNLTASIFQWLFKSTHSLVELDLSDNNLQGLFPEALGNMTSLEKLSLGSNGRQGGISKSFGNLCRLRELRMYGNGLDGMLHEIITNLSSGCLMSSLELLHLSGNQITGPLPDLIANFSSLKYLYLYDNNLSGNFTESIGLLSNLEDLYIDSNNFSGVMSEAHFFKLSKLKTLDLSSNHLRLNFSSDWSPPFQLDWMNLGSCMLGPEFPKWIKNQRNLSFLNISHSGISDSIPKWFWNFSSSVYDIHLSFNNFSATLPADLSVHQVHPQGFPGIDMGSNGLKGPLPLFHSNVRSIDLSNNSFSGSISSLCAINGGFLHFLDLSNNQLSGELPSCFNSWPKLEILILADNQFSGKIPNSIGSLSILASLSLRHNSFVGEIPWSLGNCSSLQFVDLSNNSFSGVIPYWIGERLPKLTYLLLKSNTFLGGIPLQLCQLTNILLLDLSDNILSGSVPGCIDQMTALTRKEISVKDYAFIFARTNEKLAYANLYANTAAIIWKGTGYEFHNIKNLIVVDLSNNKLSGHIPVRMWSLIGLVQLNLSRNLLTGGIPTEMEQMQKLNSLDLSRNQLSAQLPPSMFQLTSLGVLSVSYNNFSGKVPPGPQSYEASSFIGNLGLCGLALNLSCPGDDNPNSNSTDNAGKGNQKDEDGFLVGFKPGLEIGAGIGFVGVLALRLDHPWKHLVYLLLNKLKVWLDNFTGFLCFITKKLAFILKENAAKLRRKFDGQESPSVSA